MAVDVEPLKNTTHVSPAPPALQQVYDSRTSIDWSRATERDHVQQPIEAAKPETAPEEQQQLNPPGASAVSRMLE